MEQPLRRRHAEQRAHLAGPARLTEDRDVPRIAAETRDVVADPFESGDDVLHPRVARLGKAVAAELREIREPEDVQTVRDRNDDDVVLEGEIGAVVRNHVG